jgi:hypothetical protein
MATPAPLGPPPDEDREFVNIDTLDFEEFVKPQLVSTT